MFGKILEFKKDHPIIFWVVLGVPIILGLLASGQIDSIRDLINKTEKKDHELDKKQSQAEVDAERAKKAADKHSEKVEDIESRDQDLDWHKRK